MLIRLNRQGPIYQQVYRAVRKAVLSRQLPAGTRLPATRQLASELQVSRNVVLMAYERLIAEGYAVPQTGSGTYVAAILPAQADRLRSRNNAAKEAQTRARLSSYGERIMELPHASSRIDPKYPFSLKYNFQYGVATLDGFPHSRWRRLVARRTQKFSSDYSGAEGHASLRGAVADYLRRARAVVCEVDQVVIVNGSQQALDLIARLLLNSGDGVAIEEPHYHGAREIFLSAGAQLIPVRVDSSGLRVDEIPAQKNLRLAFVTPSHQFPTGAVLSLERRLALIAWAQCNQAYIIEDDYDGEYRYDAGPLESMQGLDQAGRVIYVGTFSKVLFPSLRVGYMVLPKHLIRPFIESKWLTDRHTSTLPQEVLADFIREGHFERYLRRALERNRGRMKALVSAVRNHMSADVKIHGGTAGEHVLMELPGINQQLLNRVVLKAAEQRVGVYSAAPFYLRSPQNPGLLLGYGSLNERQIEEGIKRLAGVMRSLRPPSRKQSHHV